MCLAIPAKVISVRDSLARVEAGGVERDISLMLLPQTSVGDYVLVHAGFAIEKVTGEEAQETYALLNEMAGGAREFELSDACGERG